MLKTKLFYDKPLSAASEQLERYLEKTEMRKEQIVSVSLGVSDNGVNRILLVYESEK